MVRDVVLTRNEVDELMAGQFTSSAAPTGTTRPSDWLQDNSDNLGRRYVSELGRNFRRIEQRRWIKRRPARDEAGGKPSSGMVPPHRGSPYP